VATVNNPPTPVLASVTVVMYSDIDCAAIKLKFGITSGTHGTNPSQAGKQSHHILQNALLLNSQGNRMITAYSGLAVMLAGGSAAAGSEHDIANKWQALRRRADQKALNPRPTVGDIKQWGKNDLAAAFQQGKPSRTPAMTDAEAEKLADCLVKEAEEQLNEHRKDNGLPKLNDNNRVTNSPSCFPMDTLVWTSQAVPVQARYLEVGDRVETAAGTRRIARLDYCFAELFEIFVGDETIALSGSHRVRLADGQQLAANRVRAGHRLRTRDGVVSVVSVGKRDPQRIVAVALDTADDCFVGRSGVAIEAEHRAPPIVAFSQIEG
jgi:hypothetical protein